MKFKFKKIIAMSTLCFCLFSSIAYAATYTAYTLPRFKGNNYTNAHQKVTNDQYISNKVTALSGTSNANFWVVDENKDSQSPKYEQGVSNSATRINFNNSSNLAAGQNVIMAMENSSFSSSYGFVSGEVDFR